MGGKGSGGQRNGAGRKRKSDVEKALTGDPGHRGRLLTHPSASVVPEVPPVDEFDAPDELKTDERNVWLKLAPLAFKNRTLTKATSYAFCLLCRNIVLERQYAQSVTDRGGANHRGLIQRIDAELLAFNLRPIGKPMLEGAEQPAKPANPLTRFLSHG